MRRELRPVVAMGILLAASQLVAIAISPLFWAGGLQAFENPTDPANTLIYILMILIFTVVILALVRFRRRHFAKYVILSSIFLTLFFIMLLPLYYGLFYGYFAFSGATDEAQIEAIATLLGNIATVLSLALAAFLVWALVKYPEWYVVDAIGFATAAGVTAIMGISFGILPAFLLLLGLAAYDAVAVYRTKHMVTLADELTSQRLPVLLVVPKHAGYSFQEQKSLKEQVASGEEREAMFIGLGDLIIPGVLSVSAFISLNTDALNAVGLSLGPLPPYAVVALATVLGTLVGFAILMRFVLRGNPQAGLPLLNGGAIVGYALAYLLVYRNLSLGLF